MPVPIGFYPAVPLGLVPLATGQLDALQYAFVAATASGSTQVVPAQAGQRIAVLAVAYMAGQPVSVTWLSGTTPISPPFPLGANGGFTLPYQGQPWFTTAPGQALQISQSAATTTPTAIHVLWVATP